MFRCLCLLLLAILNNIDFSWQTSRFFPSTSGPTDIEQSCSIKRKFLSLTFSSDGKYVAATWGNPPEREKVQIWSAASGEDIGVLSPNNLNHENDLAFSTDYQYLALSTGYGQETQVEIWAIQSSQRKYVIPLDTHQLTGIRLSFALNGHYLFSTDEDGTNEWDIQTGRSIRRFAESESVVDEAISPNSRYLAQTGETSLSLWDIETGKQVLHINDSAFAFAFSSDSKLFYMGRPQNLSIWDVEKGTQTLSFDPAQSGSYRAAFSPDNKYLVTGSAREFYPVVVWNLETGKMIYTYKPVGGIYPVQFSKDGKRLLLVDSSNDAKQPEIMRIIELPSGEEISNYMLPAASIRTFSPNGETYFSIASDGNLRALDVKTGESRVWC